MHEKVQKDGELSLLVKLWRGLVCLLRRVSVSLHNNIKMIFPEFINLPRSISLEWPFCMLQVATTTFYWIMPGITKQFYIFCSLQFGRLFHLNCSCSRIARCVTCLYHDNKASDNFIKHGCEQESQANNENANFISCLLNWRLKSTQTYSNFWALSCSVHCIFLRDVYRHRFEGMFFSFCRFLFPNMRA